MLNTKKHENNIIFFFIAKKVKRDSLYESKSVLLSNNIKLLKSTKTIEKNIRKIPLLSDIIKSSVLIGTTFEKNINTSQLTKLCATNIPGLDFLGVLVNSEYFSKTRIKSNHLVDKTLFWKTLMNNSTQGFSNISSSLVSALSITSCYLKNKN